MKHSIVIIGAGPCGLGALSTLIKRGKTDILLYEQSDHAGGASSTFTEKGFIWDIGGHVLGTKHSSCIQDIRALSTQTLTEHTRSAWVRMGTTMVPYPIQYHTDSNLRHAKHVCESSFYDWIIGTFGKKLAQSFFLPYNQKLWKYPLRKMSTTWIQEKIPQKDRQSTGGSWGGNAVFYYPSHGGIGSIWAEIADTLKKHILYHKQVTEIDVKKHEITFLDGSTQGYDHLLSTIPLPTLSGMVKGKDIQAVATLPYVGIAVVGIGMKGRPPEALRHCHWIYIPSPDISFFRVSVYSNYGTGNAPYGSWSLLFETTIQPNEKVNVNDFVEKTITQARECGLLASSSRITSTFFHRESFAYPVPTMDRDDVLKPVQTVLEENDIYSRGRFGAWKYEEGNMDDAWIQGASWGKSI